MSYQLGLLAPDRPRLSTPPDLDERTPWHNCGPAAIASLTGKTIAEVGRAMPHKKGYMSPADAAATLSTLGCTHTERPFAWPTWGLVMVVFDGPWMAPGLPTGAVMERAHWIAVDLADPRGAGAVYDVNAGKPIYLDYWRHRLVVELALGYPRATGGWQLRLGFEVTPPADAASDGASPGDSRRG